MPAHANQPTYNYRRFTPEEYAFEEFTGLDTGDQYADAELLMLDGAKARLSDFLDKPLVLETGSMTCPMYAQSAPPMQTMAERLPDLKVAVGLVKLDLLFMLELGHSSAGSFRFIDDDQASTENATLPRNERAGKDGHQPLL